MAVTLAFNVAPASNVSEAVGCCVMVGPLAVTAMVELVPVTPLTVALTTALPVLTAVINPTLFTETMNGLLLVQLVAYGVTVTPEAF